MTSRPVLLVFAACLIFVLTAHAQYPASSQVSKDGTSVQLEDYATLPLSSPTKTVYPPTIDYAYHLARVNFLHSEPTNAPAASSRFFVADSNRNLYILDKTNRTFTPYINFEEVFPRYSNYSYAGGLIAFEFDPEYATNGKFYTTHTETNKAASYYPVNTSLPYFNTNGYTPTAIVNPPAGTTVWRESVLIEWTDTNTLNTTFEGTARELLRIGYNHFIHPIGDLAFNPVAKPGDADYRNLYIASGDGGAGEQTDARHTTPQRLDALQGKILRITPDLALRPADTLSANGRYRIPSTGTDPNPFLTNSLAGLRKEIYAYGFRNCHRIAFDLLTGKLIESDIGMNSWEEVNIINKGGNYGYAEREGTEQYFVTNAITGSQMVPVVAFPGADSLSVTGIVSTVTPQYPVTAYSHRDGDAIAGGFVYRGKLMPALYGKFIFGDITTGRIFYSDFAQMLAADDGNRLTVATNHELQIVYNGMKRRVFDILNVKYHARGGTLTDAVPGGCGGLLTSGNDSEGVPYGCGRADIRLAQDSDGEMYLLSKSDGMIRKFSALLIPPTIKSVSVTNTVRTLTWPAISNRVYRVQYKALLTDSNWLNLSGDVIATNATAFKSDTNTATSRFYRLQALP